MDDTRESATGGDGGSEGPPTPPRPVNLVVVAGALVLIGLVAFVLYRRAHPAQPTAPVPSASPTSGASGEKTEQGTQIAAAVPVHLTPEAAVIAERYRCVCSCNDPLNVCTCSKTPGSRDMRLYVQQLVDQKKTPREIDTAMADRYGSSVLIGASAPAPSPTPARKKR